MQLTSATSRLRLPYRSPLPDDPRRRPAARALRITVYALIALMLIAVVVQFQAGTLERLNRPEGEKSHKGAVARWAPTVRAFWEGHNIYEKDTGPYRMHPNMPFVVILLTPLAYLSVPTMALVLNIAKLVALAASVGMVARLAAHHEQKIADWVVALGLAWTIQILLSDIQHGNTNMFVLLMVVLHLWLYRRGNDAAAGAALAVAVCLKLTPALFVLYWLYQRNWRLVAWTALAGVAFVVVVPVAAVGLDQYRLLMDSWLKHLILPGAARGAWFPIHINQSLSGVISRYFLAGPDGDAFYNPDDYLVYGNHPMQGHITLLAVSPAAAKWVLRVGQVAIVAAIAWAVGWRKLPRTDGRRALHYGMVVLGMLLLNQRTWMHHATVMLIAAVAIWQAVAFGLMQRRVRGPALWLTMGAGVITWLTASDLFRLYARLTGDAAQYGKVTVGQKMMPFGELWADFADAAGPQFWTFLCLLIASVIVSRTLRHGGSPYATQRQKLSTAGPEQR
ncbi:MAG: glycosyltransferase family 87 protein [Planctomycetota bacterium]|jgi:alpha-1,2-mannosyltransferase